MATLKYLSQYFTTALNVGGGIDDSQTTGIILLDVSGVDITKPGQICITYSDPIDTSVAEWIDYTSINGSNELVGAVRGREGYSAHAHLQSATVAFVMSASHHNDVVDLLNGTEAGIKIKTALYDANGNEVIKTPATTSAVNEVTITNSATGNAVQVSATGDDTNIDLTLSGKGTGVVKTTNQALTTPKVTTSINDANGNEVFITPATASAVNEITVTNSATGQPVQVAASGGDTNIDLKLGVKGTGLMRIPMKRQGGHADSFFTAGTTTYSETDTFIQTGVVSVTITTGGTRAYADVTFPVAFGQVPNVIVSPSINPVLASGNVECYVDNAQSTVSASGFRVYGQIQNIGTTTEVRVSWIAIGRK